MKSQASAVVVTATIIDPRMQAITRRTSTWLGCSYIMKIPSEVGVVWGRCAAPVLTVAQRDKAADLRAVGVPWWLALEAFLLT